MAWYLARRVHNAAEESGGTQLASVQVSIAGLLREKGNLDGVIAMYKKALEIIINSLGEDHAKVGDTYNNIASVLEA